MRVFLFALVFTGSLVMRIVMISQYSGGMDAQQFGISAQIFADGGNILREQFYWNYSPMLGGYLAPLTAAPIPFRFTLRLMLTGGEFLCALLLFRRAPITGVLYWMNPATSSLIAVQSQFEMLATTWLVCAVACFSRAQSWRFASNTSRSR